MNDSIASRFKHKQLGFTIIEVSLFLALSGLLAVGLIASANSSITRQRYNDSMNDFADFLRNAYTDTMNVSNDSVDASSKLNGGRSPMAIYGKFIVFGEKNEDNQVSRTIYTYDVVGKAISSGSAASSNILDMLYKDLNANIISQTCSGATCTNTFYRMNSYNIPWNGVVQKPNTEDTGAVDKNLFSGAILIVRSPNTGGIHTYVYQGAVKDYHKIRETTNTGPADLKLFRDLINTEVSLQNRLHEGELNMCLDSPDNRNANRRNYRILKGANNTTGVYLVGLDDEGKDEDEVKGSRCLGAGH